MIHSYRLDPFHRRYRLLPVSLLLPSGCAAAAACVALLRPAADDGDGTVRARRYCPLSRCRRCPPFLRETATPHSNGGGRPTSRALHRTSQQLRTEVRLVPRVRLAYSERGRRTAAAAVRPLPRKALIRQTGQSVASRAPSCE